jgi:hypothetical protein
MYSPPEADKLAMGAKGNSLLAIRLFKTGLEGDDEYEILIPVSSQEA